MISSKRHNKYCLKRKKKGEKGKKKLGEMGPIFIHLKKKAVLFLNSFPGPFCSEQELRFLFLEFSYQDAKDECVNMLNISAAANGNYFYPPA